MSFLHINTRTNPFSCFLLLCVMRGGKKKRLVVRNQKKNSVDRDLRIDALGRRDTKAISRCKIKENLSIHRRKCQARARYGPLLKIQILKDLPASVS